MEGCEVIYVSVGDNVSCGVKFESDRNLRVVFEANNANATFVDETKSVVYTQLSDDPVYIKYFS